LDLLLALSAGVDLVGFVGWPVDIGLLGLLVALLVVVEALKVAFVFEASLPRAVEVVLAVVVVVLAFRCWFLFERFFALEEVLIVLRFGGLTCNCRLRRVLLFARNTNKQTKTASQPASQPARQTDRQRPDSQPRNKQTAPVNHLLYYSIRYNLHHTSVLAVM
jgi:hypothetical protein